MSLFGGLFDNPAIKNMAFKGLRKIMVDENLTAIILRNNPEKTDGDLPGFDVDMFRVPIVIFEGDGNDLVAITKQEWENFQFLYHAKESIIANTRAYAGLTPEHAAAFSDPEVKDMINRYLKAKKLQNGTDNTEDASDPDRYTTGPEYE